MERVASRGVTMFSAAEVAALLLLLPFVAVAPAAAATGSSGCTSFCGNVSVEYPFGVEPGCYRDGFNLTCRKGELFLGDGTMQVLEISIPNGTVRVNSSSIVFHRNDEHGNAGRNRTWGAGLRESGPYFLSGSANRIALVGCNAQVDIHGGKNNTLVGSCTAICPSDGNARWVAGAGIYDACSGIGCCQTNIVLGYSSYDIQIHYLNGSFSPFGSDLVYIVDQGFNYGYFIYNLFILHKKTVPQALPASLEWVISNSTCPTNASAPECRSAHSSCQDSYAYSGHGGYRCRCSDGYQGNPYVPDGCRDIDECAAALGIYPCYGNCSNTQGGYHCQCLHGFEGNASTPNGCEDIDECSHRDLYPCYGICINIPGSFHCRCGNGTYGDPFTKGGCIAMKKSLSGLSIGLGVAGDTGLLLLALAAPVITRKIKVQKVKKIKERFFKQNHGILLQQLMSQRADISERMIITLGELEKATDNFDKSREVGGGGHGVVYKGILDLQVVAIKKSKIVVQREIDDFINEVAILSQINHRNVVKLIGCCLETEVPLLVYEFISNGTLDHHLHVGRPISLSWDDRLRIALEISRALAYLHSATSIPVFHRDIKSSNILLDDNLTAKVSDFGASRYIPIDQTGVTTAIQGTIGYLDPMYYYTGRLTDKSDVFSFGVLVIELLTRKKPFNYRSKSGDGLVSHFASLLTEGKLADIIDPQVMEEEDEDVQEVAALAVTCTKLKREDRPTMKEVEMTLENLRTKKKLAPHTTTPRKRDTIQVEGATQEASRQYSMEEEFLLSSRYPR